MDYIGHSLAKPIANVIQARLAALIFHRVMQQTSNRLVLISSVLLSYFGHLVDGRCQRKIQNTWSGHRTAQIDPEKCRKINGREIRVVPQFEINCVILPDQPS